jgi:hypothetical protein
MNWRAIGAVVLGAVLIGYGVMCGVDVMSPGDMCETTRRGITRTYTYEEMKENASLAPFGAMGVGALFILYGGFQLWRAKKKAAAAAPAADATPAA